MKNTQMRTLAVVGAALAFGAVTPTLAADDKDDKFGAKLSGYNEVHFIAGNAAAIPPVAPALRGAVSTAAKGRFKAEINDSAQSIHYELSYADLEGTVTQAHIHFGQHHSVGGIVVWLCQTAGTPAPAAVAAATPTCPASGTVTGTIAPAQVLAVAGQGIDAGQYDELVRAIRAGATYANVHSSLFPPGEIRGQLRDGDGHRH
ncbi:MAG: CHRD domain-containing protein [Burkholderiales bacterium]